MNKQKSSNGSILIVDDNRQNLQVLGSLLTKEKYNVCAIHESIKVMDFLKTNPVDLILLDIMMPNIDGLTLCDMIKKEKDLNNIPIIFMTAINDTEHQLKAFNRGAVDYITKPFQNEIVLARVKTHLTLKKQYETLEKINATKNKLFSIISHDLRTPLAAIMGFSEPDPNGNPDNYKKHKEYINKSSRQMMKLIDAVSIWNKNQQDTLQLLPMKLDLNDIIMDCEDSLILKLNKKKIKIVKNYDPDFTLSGDYKMLNIVFCNLITNSIKFSRENSEIIIKAEKTDNENIISITDKGIGIPVEIQNQILQHDNITSRSGTNGEQGTGLGLIICYDLIKIHGGNILLKSSENQGTTFIIKLPKKIKMEKL